MSGEIDIVEQFKTGIAPHLQETFDSFPAFITEIFPASFEEFAAGDHVMEKAEFFQEHKRTMELSARDHFKSTGFYAYLMWRIWRLRKYPHDEEWKYFSYSYTMAAYHLSGEPHKLKYHVQRNPYFKDIIDLKPTAEVIHKYTWDGKHFVSITPAGLKSFARGMHPYGVIVDDPFQDPENKMLLTDIYKINDKLKTNIIDMPREELHIAGTAQTTEDFYFDDAFRDYFEYRELPAIIDWKEELVQWPEFWPFERLMEKRGIQGEKIFAQESMCSPAFSEDAFFTQLQISTVSTATRNWDIYGTEAFTKDAYVTAYLDIGKKQHPSHLAVFMGSKKGRAVMIHSKFMDGWQYIDQLDYCQQAIGFFDIDWFGFDNTRGEFEFAVEQHILPKPMKPHVHKRKTNDAMASAFGERVEKETVELLDDLRLGKSILSVTNDLKALETPEGHGDAFWSCGGALWGLNQTFDMSKWTGQWEKNKNKKKRIFDGRRRF